MNSQTLFKQALQLHQSGRLDEAIGLYRQLLKTLPKAAEIHFNLGYALLARGRQAEALDCFRQLTKSQPKLAEAHLALGNALARAGEHQAAAQSFRHALQIRPDLVEAHMNLGNVLSSLGRHEDAIASLTRAVRLKPALALAHYNLANACKAAGRFEAAEAAYREALSRDANLLDAYLNLGVVLEQSFRWPDAALCYQKVIAVQPRHAEAHFNLGRVQSLLADRQAAELSYRQCLALQPRHFQAWTNLGVVLRAKGEPQEAIECYRRAAEIEPENVRAYTNLAQILIEFGQSDLAIEGCERALQIDPDNPDILKCLGEAFREKKDSTSALTHLQRAMVLRPDSAGVMASLAGVYSNLGRLDEGIALYRRALQLQPANAGLHDGLLFDLCHMETVGRDEIFQAHLAYGRQFEVSPAGVEADWKNTRDPDRRLRVGFVSGDFFAHPVASFIEPVLQALDREAIDVYAYSNRFREDAVTERLKALLPHWQCVAGLTDDELVDVIQRDTIDILIDLSGHTAGNRLTALARKPAPLQASWIGFPSTTGLQAMDYYFADSWAAPPGLLDDYFTEHLVRLPCIATFKNEEVAPDVNALPALCNGHITFGSFNKPQKLGPRTLSLWIRVLEAVPNSRMIFAAMSDPVLSEAIRVRFAAAGIAPERLEFRPNLPFQEYLALHHEVDIALDPLAFNGWTTTNHALWMGVPWITRQGDTLASRAGGGATLHHIGLDDFIADSEDDYIRLAQYWSDNMAVLAEIRKGMRERIRNSPLRKSELVARGLEQALRIVWRRWVAGEPACDFTVSATRSGPSC